MHNELIFIVFILLDLFLALLSLKYFGKTGLIVFYVVHVVLVQITIQMQVDIFGYTAVVGSMLFAALFMSTDVLTEHYGKKEGYRAVLMGAGSLVLFLIVINVSMLFNPSDSNTIAPAFITLFGGQWRITISDLIISYLVFQSLDVWIYHKIYEWTGTKHLWLRNCGSTFISQTIIAITFFQAAFAGTIEQSVLWQIILAGLAIKLLIALMDTPFVYLSHKFLPKDKIPQESTQA